MTQPDRLSLSCNACGAPLKVHAGTRFVTCARCGMQLQVHQDASALFTGALQQVQSQTASLVTEVTWLRLQLEIEALDRDWTARRDVLCDRDKGGRLREPSTTAAFVTGAMGGVMGVVWRVMTTSAGAPGLFSLMGLGFAAVSVFPAVGMQSRAQAFQSARDDHLPRRARRLAELQVAGTPAPPQAHR